MAATARTTINAEGDGVYTQMKTLLGARHGAKDIHLFSGRLSRGMLLGEVRSRYRGRGMEFEEVRQYQPGDDVRYIDWRVTARSGSTYSKLFTEERERPVHLLLDQRSTMFFGSGARFKSVVAAEIAAYLAWAALAGSDRIGGQVIGDRQARDVRAKRNHHAVVQFLQAAHAINNALPGDGAIERTLSQALEECRRLTRPGTAIFVISDFNDLDDGVEAALVTLGRHCDLTLLFVADRLEAEFDVRGKLAVSDGDELLDVQANAAFRERYLHNRKRHLERVTSCANNCRGVLVPVSTDVDPKQFLRRLYAK
jgi:uncharacterized protein (DUF58 family)